MTRVFEASSLLIVMAMREEAQSVFDRAGATLVFTGVGKVNAAYALTRAIARLTAEGRRPGLVVNFGTAGSECFATGSLVACHRFVQADMDARALGFQLGQTPFDAAPQVLEFDPVFTHLPVATCASADRFDDGRTSGHPREAVDMEAYALSKVCHLERLPFACAKYISDGADPDAARDWQTSLPIAARHFAELYALLSGDG